MWQQSGSDDRMEFSQAQTYIRSLNQSRFTGHSDWRLPTIPELISLLEPEKNNKNRYIDPLFDNKQLWCWSSDRIEGSSGAAWYVDFCYGSVYWSYFDDNGYVRGVRIQTM